MDLPLGYFNQSTGNTQNSNKLVCRLHKSIFGLKQGSREQFSKFYAALTSHGYHQSKSDYSLFTKGFGNSFVTLLLYVDYIIITGSNCQAIDSSKIFLHSHFKLKLKDLCQLKYFLGLEIARSHKGIFLSQRHYTLQILEDTGFMAYKPALLPMDPKVRL